MMQSIIIVKWSLHKTPEGWNLQSSLPGEHITHHHVLIKWHVPTPVRQMLPCYELFDLCSSFICLPSMFFFTFLSRNTSSIFPEFYNSFSLSIKTWEENNEIPTSQLAGQKYDNALLVDLRSWGYLCGTGTSSKNNATTRPKWTELAGTTSH